VVGALLAPLVIWLPLLGGRLGLPVYPYGGAAVDLWHFQVFYLVGLGIIAAMVAAHDRWLGAMVGLGALLIFYRGARMDPTQTVMLALGALLLIGVRYTPAEWRGTLVMVLVGLGTFQALYIIGQFFGYDPGFLRFGDGGEPRVQTIGSIGTVGSAATFLAITAPLMPLPLLVLALVSIGLTFSRTAVIAVALGLAVRYRATRVPLLIAAGGVGLYALAGYMKGSISAGLTASTRVEVWTFGLSDWARTDPLFGIGLGGWLQRIPDLQRKAQFAPSGELWAQAHNEYVQWTAETGLVGLALLMMWLWSHRAMFAHAQLGGALAALAVDCVTWFPFHVVPVALVALIVIGLAMVPLTTDAAPVGG
jgi:O-antigen ligase/polysaccharide polymerase Wzy-like membrane protein